MLMRNVSEQGGQAVLPSGGAGASEGGRRMERVDVAMVRADVATARARAQRDGIPFEVALERVRLEGAAVANEVIQRAQLQATSTGTTVPPMPDGVVTLQQARAHLAATLPGWDAMGNDDRFHAMQVLTELLEQAEGVKLSKQAAPNGKPTLLLCLFPGETPARRALSYLGAVTKGWASLPYDARWEAFQQLKKSHNLVDVADVEEAP